VHLDQRSLRSLQRLVKLTNPSVLYVRNFHFEPSGSVFSAGSSACNNLIALGSMGIMFATIIGGAVLYCLYAGVERSKALTLTFIILGALAAVFSFAGALAAQIGTVQTCGIIFLTLDQFSQSSFTCSQQLDNGFYNGDDISNLYRLSLGVIYAGCAAAWGMAVSWVMFTSLEFYSYHYESAKWW
jgi:hypothetical protein